MSGFKSKIDCKKWLDEECKNWTWLYVTKKTRVRSFHELPMPGAQELHGSWWKVTWASGNSRIIAARSTNGHKVWLLQSKTLKKSNYYFGDRIELGSVRDRRMVQ
jgi:hypothetical protein